MPLPKVGFCRIHQKIQQTLYPCTFQMEQPTVARACPSELWDTQTLAEEWSLCTDVSTKESLSGLSGDSNVHIQAGEDQWCERGVKRGIHMKHTDSLMVCAQACHITAMFLARVRLGTFVACFLSDSLLSPKTHPKNKKKKPPWLSQQRKWPMTTPSWHPSPGDVSCSYFYSCDPATATTA